VAVTSRPVLTDYLTVFYEIENGDALFFMMLKIPAKENLLTRNVVLTYG